MSTHRCKNLLERNKNYKQCDSEDWDIQYMTPIGVVDYCPFCGVKLNVE